jgi:hypothetical protein
MMAGRTASGRFAKGASGNEGGRPRVVKPLQDLARTHTAMAIRVLAHVARKGKNESARIMAASMLLDRGFGKPPQAVDMCVLFDRKLTELSPEELVMLEERLVAMGAEQPPEDEAASTELSN